MRRFGPKRPPKWVQREAKDGPWRPKRRPKRLHGWPEDGPWRPKRYPKSPQGGILDPKLIKQMDFHAFLGNLRFCENVCFYFVKSNIFEVWRVQKSVKSHILLKNYYYLQNLLIFRLPGRPRAPQARKMRPLRSHRVPPGSPEGPQGAKTDSWLSVG